MIYKTDVKCFNFFLFLQKCPLLQIFFIVILEKKLHIKWVHLATRLEYFKTLYLSQPNPVKFFLCGFQELLHYCLFTPLDVHSIFPLSVQLFNHWFICSAQIVYHCVFTLFTFACSHCLPLDMFMFSSVLKCSAKICILFF